MSRLENYFNHHAFGFWLALLIAFAILAAWTIWSQLRAARSDAAYRALVSEVKDGNVHAMLNEYLQTVRGVATKTSDMSQRVDFLYESLPSLVSHVGLVRFSPFHDTGGDQSFSLALLDGKGDGVVISGLHSRTDDKLYAKPIVNRSSNYSLTDEERQALLTSSLEARIESEG